MDQSARNRRYGPKRIRSAKAPVMRTGVMIANIIWKVAKTSPEMVSRGHGSCFMTFCHMKKSCHPPTHLPVPKLMEKPMKNHIRLMKPMATKFCTIMSVAAFCRTRPP